MGKRTKTSEAKRLLREFYKRNQNTGAPLSQAAHFVQESMVFAGMEPAKKTTIRRALYALRDAREVTIFWGEGADDEIHWVGGNRCDQFWEWAHLGKEAQRELADEKQSWLKVFERFGISPESDSWLGATFSAEAIEQLKSIPAMQRARLESGTKFLTTEEIVELGRMLRG